MQWASGGRSRLGNLPTVRMSLLLAHIILNQSRKSFICCDGSEWVKYLLRLTKKDTKRGMWAGFESDRKQFKSSPLTFSLFFPMQMSDCHSPSEPDGWAECVALSPSHTHTLCDVGWWWWWWWWGSHGSVALVLPFCPSVQHPGWMNHL